MNINGKKGVDISSANGNVSIEKIKKAGYDFVMIRCGYGSDIASQDDSQFENNVKKCEAAGVPWGAYLYSYALNTDEAKSEARHVARLLKNKKPTMPVAFDMEDGDEYGRYRARRRDSRGRYMDDGFHDRLRELMDSAPDEATRSALRKMMNNMA